MMAKSKETASNIMRPIPLDQALPVQDNLGEYAQFLLHSSGGESGPKNPPNHRRKGGRKRTTQSPNLVEIRGTVTLRLRKKPVTLRGEVHVRARG